jgi:hypothetical protein
METKGGKYAAVSQQMNELFLLKTSMACPEN